MYFATQPRPALTAALLQIWQWCPEKIILPSHRWKKNDHRRSLYLAMSNLFSIALVICCCNMWTGVQLLETGQLAPHSTGTSFNPSSSRSSKVTISHPKPNQPKPNWSRPIKSGQLRFWNVVSHFLGVQIFQIDIATSPPIYPRSNFFRYICRGRNERLLIVIFLEKEYIALNCFLENIEGTNSALC